MSNIVKIKLKHMDSTNQWGSNASLYIFRAMQYWPYAVFYY